MPFKSLSVIEVPKEELAGSARSNGSTEDKADGGYITSSNPFKPSNNVPLGKQKSMQVGNFSARSNNSNLNESNNNHGFKIPDSSFAFQPHNTNMPFGAGAPFA